MIPCKVGLLSNPDRIVCLREAEAHTHRAVEATVIVRTYSCSCLQTEPKQEEEEAEDRGQRDGKTTRAFPS